MAEKKQPTQEEKSKVFTFLTLGFPTLLIVGIAMLTTIAETWWVVLGLAVYQFLLMKQFIDRYYEVF